MEILACRIQNASQISWPSPCWPWTGFLQRLKRSRLLSPSLVLSLSLWAPILLFLSWWSWPRLFSPRGVDLSVVWWMPSALQLSWRAHSVGSVIGSALGLEVWHFLSLQYFSIKGCSIATSLDGWYCASSVGSWRGYGGQKEVTMRRLQMQPLSCNHFHTLFFQKLYWPIF